ncbi:MAG: hypothetical protein Ct9H90mP7_2780 [Candidatus Neomarinimicrobiota bacterium]|nr:MAG: hypothetical protein Ct9H90mP7_2780 [Candidatus Neomarinimicrobiota bacterium]
MLWMPWKGKTIVGLKLAVNVGAMLISFISIKSSFKLFFWIVRFFHRGQNLGPNFLTACLDDGHTLE